MTTQQQQTPMSDYFASYDQPLLGGDPFLNMNNNRMDEAWDADLHPHEYGDQSGHVGSTTSWDEHSFTDSECEEDEFSCFDDDDENDQPQVVEDEPWNMVYTTTSITVTTATDVNSCVIMNDGEEKCPDTPPSPLHNDTMATAVSHQHQQQRRDSTKVTFSATPPQEHNYESGCSRAEHAQLYYSVHELQKFIEELRLETGKKQQLSPSSSSSSCAPPATASHGSGMIIVARSS